MGNTRHIYTLIFFFLFVSHSFAGRVINESLEVQGKITATSTTVGSHPCPTMTDTQMLAISSPVGGDCVYNSTLKTLLVYDATLSLWEEIGGGGGINNWVTATDYEIGDVVIESNKIYQCSTGHTSGTFASQIANWTQLSNNVSDVTGTLPLSNGGTNKNITANNGAIAYTDADSLELLAPGTSGQILQTNGAGAPSFVDKSISGKAQQATAVTLKEIQVYNNQLTDMTLGKYLLESGNNNLLKDPSYEGDISTTPWTGPNGIGTTFAIHGAQHGSRNYTAAQANIFQDSTTNAGGFIDKNQQGVAMIYVKTNSSANNVYVCARQAGVLIANSDGTKITNCVLIPNDAKWNLAKLPVILGPTSNGIAVVSLNPATAALQNMTGYVDVDGAFLGLVDSEFSAVNQQSYRISQGGSSLTNRNAEIQYNLGTASITNLGSALIVASDDSGSTRTRFTATTDVNVQINFSTAIASTGFSITIYKNGSSVLLGDSNSNAGFIASAAYSMSLSAGDYFSVGTEGDVSNTTSPANLSFIATSGTMKTYSASCGANCIDGFSAQASSTDVVTNENVNWINGDCTNATTGQGTCTFTSGIFTVAPNCNVTLASVNMIASIISVSSTSITYETRNLSGAQINNPVSIFCQKQGADFVATRTIVGSFNEVMTTPGVGKPKTCYYAFGGASATLSSPTLCTTGTCVETYDSCGTGTPPSFGATGNYNNLTFTAGTFANSSYVDCKSQAYALSSGAYNSQVYFETGDNTWQTTSSGGLVTNIGSYNVLGTAVNSYVSVKCEGVAP